MSVCPLYFSVAQLCLTLCDPMDCSPPGSSVHGILQSRILEWVAMPFSRGSSSPMVGTCCLLQWQADSLPLSHMGSPCLGKDGQREAVRLSPVHSVVLPCRDSGLLGCFAHRRGLTGKFIAFLLVPNEL